MSASRPSRARGRPPGPPVDPQERRELLLDAAERAIDEAGPDVSLAQIADAAGLTRSAVYAAFADRDALISALAHRHSQQVVTRLWEVSTGADDPYQQVRLAVDVLAAWFEEHPHLASLLDRHADSRPEGRPRSTFMAASLAEILARGFEARGLDSAPARTWAEGLVGAVSSAVRWWAHTQEISKDDLVDHLTALIWAGFAGASTPL